ALASDDSRNLWRDDKAHGSRFADMFEEDRVALFFLAIGLHDIELRAADTKRRHHARYGCFRRYYVGKSVKGANGPIESVNVRSGSSWNVFSVWLHRCCTL